MYLHFRGWGGWVLVVLFGWLFLLIGIVIATRGPEPDLDADADTYRLFALAFALSAETLYRMSWVRERRALRQLDAMGDRESDPLGLDTMMWVPIRYWSVFFGLVAVGLLVRSYLPSDFLSFHH